MRNAAVSLDNGLSNKTQAAAMAKLFATEHCYDVCNMALQMHGGYGYLKEYPIERYVRDLRVHTILEGARASLQKIFYASLSRSNEEVMYLGREAGVFFATRCVSILCTAFQI